MLEYAMTILNHQSMGLKKFSREQAQLSVLPPFSSTVCTFTCANQVAMFAPQQAAVMSMTYCVAIVM